MLEKNINIKYFLLLNMLIYNHANRNKFKSKLNSILKKMFIKIYSPENYLKFQLCFVKKKTEIFFFSKIQRK